MSLKRIFNKRVADFLKQNGAEYVGREKGEVAERPDRYTYFFIKNERLFKALDMYHYMK